MTVEKILNKKKERLRRCIICMNSFPKEELIRFVKSPEGTIFIDATHKANGRGAYVMKNTCLFDKKLRNKLQMALKLNISEEDFNGLIENYQKGE